MNPVPTTPVLGRPNGFNLGDRKPTDEEQAQFDRALRHVMKAYRLPRFAAADVAIRLLSFSQPAWTCACAEGDHD